MHLANTTEWDAYCKSGEKPDDIPVHPERVYRKEWKDWGDFLATGNTRPMDRDYRAFEEARALVRSWGLRNQREWYEYRRSGRKPSDIPGNPNLVYEDEGWAGYGDWLGTGTKSNRSRRFKPFAEARAYVRSLELGSSAEWARFSSSGARPDDIPGNPEKVYAGEFRGVADWLGTMNKWTKRALLAFLGDLRERLPHLAEKELAYILQEAGSLPALNAVMGGRYPLVAVIRDLRRDGEHGIQRAIEEVREDELNASRSRNASDQVLPEGAEEAIRSGMFENPPSSSPKDELQLQSVTPRGLRVVDEVSSTLTGLQEDTAEYLVENRVSALWERYVDPAGGREEVEELLRGEGGQYYDEIRRRFRAELAAVEALEVPSGWDFRVNGVLQQPNAMQRRAAWEVREKRRIGNWSGTGSGKTLAGVLASRVVDSRMTLVVAANATIEKGWSRQILNAYPDSHVHTQLPETLPWEGHSYVVLNYEKFQAPSREQLVRRLIGLQPDLAILDEVQLVKQRYATPSNRRAALQHLLESLAMINPEIRIMGMSATPVLNSLVEAKKLLELVAGRDFPELQTRPTVNNALAVHRALMSHGFRYRPRYEQEMHQEVVTATRNDLFGPLLEAGSDVLSVEQVLLPAKLRMVGGRISPGTLVYTHYVDGMVRPIQRHLEGLGLTVGLYTGQDKSGLEPFLMGEVDVLVGSRPVGTGLDGLQAVCDRIVLACLPWTAAEYEQIIGRARRQGSAFGRVEIVLPQVILERGGDSWSWDRGRMACIRHKRTLADCAVDGRIPDTVAISPTEFLAASREALERWIHRVESVA